MTRTVIVHEEVLAKSIVGGLEGGAVLEQRAKEREAVTFTAPGIFAVLGALLFSPAVLPFR